MLKKAMPFIAAALIGVMTVPAFASQTSAEQNATPDYLSFTGTVQKIQMPQTSDAAYNEIILAENDEGGQMAFHVDDNTYFLTGGSPTEGDTVTGFYEAKAAMTMIYPPQPTAAVIAVNPPKDKTLKVARFDKDLVSDDGTLKLNIGSDTTIVLQNGDTFDGDMTNRALAVIYSISTKSIPAQTTPEKVVVLYERAVPPTYTLTDQDKAMMGVNGSTGSASGTATAATPDYTLTDADKEMMAKGNPNVIITVNGQTLDGSKPYVNDNGQFMLPIRTIAEAMNLNVEWLGESQTVQVGKNAEFTIGSDAYSINRMSPVALGDAPELKDGITYVPAAFFTDVLKAGVSYTTGSIDIQYPAE
jgi:hypothetical protein